MSKQLIYETKGRAREFNELSINLFNGCGHACIYCYGADILHQTQERFTKMMMPRATEKELYFDASAWAKKGETRRVLLCFITDPYQPLELETQITRKAITALHSFGLNVVILTKAGLRSTRDFDLLGPKDAYATTLTCDNDADSLKWEPGAALPSERIEALKEAHRKGIETWVSFEPVIYPVQTFHLLEMTHDIVGHYKVGTMNYHPHGKLTDWKKFGQMMLEKMDTEESNPSNSR
jgi:DNA repair photolyase